MIPNTQSHPSAYTKKFVTVEVDPNDPRLFAPSEDLPPKLSRARAKALYAIGLKLGIDMRPKAIAANDCGMMAASFACDNGHAREVFAKQVCYRCKQHFSECCCDYNLLVKLRKRQPLMAQLQALDLYRVYRMVEISIRWRGARTAEDRDKFQAGVRNTFKLTLGMSRDEATTFYEHSTNGWVNGEYVATGFVLSSDRDAQLHQTLPMLSDAKLRTRQIIGAVEVLECFTNMYRIIIPSRPEDQALMETLYHRIPFNDQGSRNANSFLLQPPKAVQERDGLSLEELAHEHGSKVSGPGNGSDRVDRCTICGGAATLMSPPHSKMATVAEIMRLRWKRLSPGAPPGPPGPPV